MALNIKFIFQKLWEIEDILQMRYEGEEEEVLVKWRNWEGENSWVQLQHNPELRAYLNINKCNPHSSTLAQSRNDLDQTDLSALKQAIFDALGDSRYTLDGQRGRQRRVSVKVPFRTEEFEAFRNISNVNKHGNVDCYVTGNDLNAVLGENWSARYYKTSTKSFVGFKEFIHLNWGFKERTNYDHTSCLR